jgi:hypothetical protein
MLLARKLKSAFQLYRRRGWTSLAGLAQVRTAALYRANRPVPLDPSRRTRLLATTLNRWSGVSTVAIDQVDLNCVRDTLLVPYLRSRFGEVVQTAAGLKSLQPVEIAVVADSMLSTWDFSHLDDALPDWTEAVAETKFAVRIAQTARRTALRLGRLHEADRPVPGSAEDVGALLLRGDVSDALGRMEDASKAYEAAVRRNGCDPHARRSLGFHLIKAGRVLDGLASWSVADTLSGSYPLRYHRPRWTGEPLGPRRLMVLFEHGLGDMIQMARFLPRLLEREPDATVLGLVPGPLAGLLSRAFPGVAFLTDEDREPDYDFFLPSMQLPSVLDAADLEPLTDYIDLGAPATMGRRRPRIGVCWRGHPRQYEMTRSVPLELFSTLFSMRDVDFVVLLNRVHPDEAVVLAGFEDVEVPAIRDFVELAGIVASCDLVVSVDTAVVHLAAAGGVPVLLMSRPDSCWRWGATGSRSPWYDTVEVLRHGGDMDWPRMLAAVKHRIRERCGARTLVSAGS